MDAAVCMQDRFEILGTQRGSKSRVIPPVLISSFLDGHLCFIHRWQTLSHQDVEVLGREGFSK